MSVKIRKVRMTEKDRPPEVVGPNVVHLIALDLIDPNPYQPRKEPSKEDIQELVVSINSTGLIEPLVVRSNGGRYQIIAGYRRLLACREIGMKEVPCVVRECSDAELLEIAIVENIQRTDLNPIEEAESYRKLMELRKIDQKTLAFRVGKSPATVSERLSLLSLPEDVRSQVAQRKLSIKAAIEIGRISNPKRRKTLINKASDLSLDKLRARVDQILFKQIAGRKKYEGRSAYPQFRKLFEGLEGVKRLYKNQVTFTFSKEEDFIEILRTIIKRYDDSKDLENGE